MLDCSLGRNSEFIGRVHPALNLFHCQVDIVAFARHNQTRSVAGTVFSDGKPRFIQIKGINLDADVGNHMVYLTNTDVPGVIGFIGTTLGEAKVNIANFQLGREREGGDAIALLYVDGPVSDEVLDRLRANPAIRQAKPLVFNVD